MHPQRSGADPPRVRVLIGSVLCLVVLATTGCGVGGGERFRSESLVTSLAELPQPSTTRVGPTSEATLSPPAPVRIMPLGDSLTRGDGPANPNRPQSYRGYLYQSLVAADHSIDFVGSDRTPTAGLVDPDNEGHGGFTIGPDTSVLCSGCPAANLSDHLAEWLSANPADVVLLMAGVNDLLPVPVVTADGLVRPVEPAAAAAKLTALVTRLRALSPDTTVLVASLPPLPFVAGNEVLLAAFTAVNAAAAKTADNDPSVVYVPMFEQLRDGWTVGVELLPDGLHPSAAGAEKIAGVWERALVPVLEQLEG